VLVYSNSQALWSCPEPAKPEFLDYQKWQTRNPIEVICLLLAPWPCHGPCLVMFFPKNNQRMAPTEPPMMADSPLFSATITTSHPCWTYIGAPLEYFLYSDTTNKPAFLSLPLPTSTMCYLPQHNQSPTTLHTPHMFHVPGQSYCACTSSRGHGSRTPQGLALLALGGC